MTTPERLALADDLCAFIAASPSPYHCVETVAGRLIAAGFSAPEDTTAGPGCGIVVRGGTVVAWRAPQRPSAFRIVGAHTDSPNLRIKPQPDTGKAGFRQLGVEVYGGPLLNSWLDRDLGVCGRATVAASGAGPAGGLGAGPAGRTDERLFRIDHPLLRIPQLAIHLDREINDKGLLLNKQQHLAPFWALGSGDPGAAGFAAVVAETLGCAAGDVLAWDAMVHPLEPPRVVGLNDEFVSAPRIDNQLSCWAGTEALLRVAAGGDDVGPGGVAQVLVLFDHEEVGSTSDRGADGAFLGSVLERVAAGSGLDRAAYLEALAASQCVSADCAHATNPNYADRHEPDHQISLNGGPVIKANANLRYATDAATAAVFVEACRRAGVPHQWFVNRTDLACGSTIGPLTAAALGIPTVDVGAPQLAMHSARELCGADDPAYLAAALESFWAG
jgi:aspartyl aminopeptidase